MPIDLACIKAEFPTVEVLTNGQESRLFAAAESSVILIEIGFQLDLAMITPLLDALAAQRVAILPPDTKQTAWHGWAEQVEAGVNLPAITDPSQLWRAALIGRVFDPASLATFWFELTAGAYGQIDRAKGIFDLSDGQLAYFDFVHGLPESRSRQLPVPLWLQGRPQRFSGIEVVGQALDREQIARTLHDCSLNDQAIALAQAQLTALNSATSKLELNPISAPPHPFIN